MLPSRNDKTMSARNQRSPDGLSDKPNSEPLIKPQLKLHRASIILNILCTTYKYKLQHSFNRIHQTSRREKHKYHKMGTAIHGIFRRHEHNDKFQAFYLLKKIVLNQNRQVLNQTTKMISRTKVSSAKIICLFFKHHKASNLLSALEKIKKYGDHLQFEINNNRRKSLRIINKIVHKNMIWAFSKVHLTQLKHNRRYVAKKIFNMVKVHRRERLEYTLWKLKKNVMQNRHDQVLEDIKIFEEKMENNEDPEMIALKEKREKLEEHAKKIQEQHEKMQLSLQQQVNAINTKKQNMLNEIEKLNSQNNKLEEQMKKMEEEARQPYSLDQIFQCMYNNLLLYLHENEDRLYKKQQILKKLKTPLVPVDIPLQKVKQENQAMQQLLNQYIIMFGDKRSEMGENDIELPYQYMVKENYSMYKMLMTLLPLAENDKEGLNTIKDGIFKLQCKVKQLWS